MTQDQPHSASRRTAIDIGLTFSRQFLAGFIQLGVLLIVARQLGPEGSGAFAVALLIPTLMAKLLNLGLVAANVFFISRGRFSAEEVWASSRDLMLVTALAGSVLAVLVILAFGERAFPGLERAVLLTALLVFPFSLLSSLAVGLFQALQDFRAFNISVIVQPVIALCGVIALWSTGLLSLHLVLATVVLSHAIGLAIAMMLLSRKISIAAVAKKRGTYLYPALGYGMKAHLSNILSFLNYRFDLFLVNLLIGPAAAGIYTIAVRMVEQLWMISQAASTVLFPRLAAMHQDEGGRRDLTPIIARSVFWLTLLGSVALASIAGPLIRFLFGTEFDSANPVLLVLLPGVVLFGCGRILANDMAARGFVGLNLGLASLTIVVNVIANLLLIPRYGVIGAAAGTTFSYVVSFLVSLMIQYRLNGIPWWRFLSLSVRDVSALRAAFKRTKDTNT